MNVLLTGGNGYLSSYIIRSISPGDVFTIGLENCNVNIDISSTIPSIDRSFELIIHTAGKAHVIPRNKAEEDAFFAVNYRGTLNLLEGLSRAPALPRQFVFISTVAVYGLEEGELITENHPLKGTSAYARSKIMAEEAIMQWGAKNNVPVAILRLPLIAGPDAPGNLGSMIRAIRKRYYVRFGPSSARRSMVLASDLALFIPSLANVTGIYHLTDGMHPTYRELEEYIATRFNRKIRNLPSGLVKIAAMAGDWIPCLPINSYRLKKLSYTLTFSDDKARKELGWNPRPVVGNIW